MRVGCIMWMHQPPCWHGEGPGAAALAILNPSAILLLPVAPTARQVCLLEQPHLPRRGLHRGGPWKCFFLLLRAWPDADAGFDCGLASPLAVHLVFEPATAAVGCIPEHSSCLLCCVLLRAHSAAAGWLLKVSSSSQPPRGDCCCYRSLSFT